MGIEIKGFDEAIQGLEAMKDAISAQTLLQWTSAIERTAKTNCGTQAEFKGTIDPQGKFHIKSHTTTDNIDCLIEAIKRNMLSMHPLTKAFYEKVIQGLKEEKAKKLASNQP